jgi:hypothetical protein
MITESQVDDDDDIMFEKDNFDVAALVSKQMAEVTQQWSQKLSSLEDKILSLKIKDQEREQELLTLTIKDQEREQELLTLTKVAEADREVLLIRQLAFTYQEIAARRVGCGNTKPYFVTPDKLAQHCSKDAAKQLLHNTIQQEFSNRGIIDIENCVRQIRELGTTASHPSHPTTNLCGEIVSEEIMRQIIVRHAPNIPFDHRDAEKLLEIICVLRGSNAGNVLVVTP